MPPVSPSAARVLLLLIGAAFCALAVNASVLLPLWEPADEYEHWLVVEHWARTGSLPDLNDLPRLALNEGVQPPLAYWLFAAGARALHLSDTEFLARRRFDAPPGDPVQYLHGADEVFPFRGPARTLHLLRLLDVLCGLCAIAGTYALARQLAPGRPGIAAGAAALVAFNPAFIALCGGISNDPLAVALSSAGLARLAGLVRGAPASPRSGFVTGALVGTALLAKLSTSFLLPLVPLALLLRRRRGEPWLAALRQLDWIVAGLLVVTGPFFAWNLATYGDPFGWSVIADKFGGERRIPMLTAIIAHLLPEAARSYVARLSGLLPGGTPIVIAWSLVLGGALLGALRFLPWRRLQRAPHARSRGASAAAEPEGVEAPTRRIALLLLAALLVNTVACLFYFLDFNQPHGRYLHPTLPALACLVALAWCWLPRVLAFTGGAALALVAFHAEIHDLGPAFWPPQRVHDPHFMTFDPLARVPVSRRLATLHVLSPPDNSQHVTPPTLRWQRPADGDERYSVHLSIPGMIQSLHSYENGGVSVRDAYTIPEKQWYGLPVGVPLTVQVIRLPTLEEALSAPDGALDVVQSAPLTLRRAAPGGAAAAAR